MKTTMFTDRTTSLPQTRYSVPSSRALLELLFRQAVFVLTLITALLYATASTSFARNNEQHYGISVAVLPFEVFSIGKEPSLGNDVAATIAKQLGLNPLIVPVDSRHIATVMQPEDFISMDEARLRQMAKLLNANCIIMGTVTKIRAEHSIDVELFSTVSSAPHFKTFAEGLDVARLTETLATTLDAEIIKNAAKIPQAERPRVHAVRKATASSQPGGYDVDRELHSAFGPMPTAAQPASPDPAPASPSIDISSTETAQPAPVLTETTLHDEMAPAALTETAPAPGDKDMPAPRTDNTQHTKTDPGFFSLSKAISINADSMEYDNRANRAIFKGNVVARQDDITMFANAMQVYYTEAGGLSRVDATGSVRVVQGDRIATGESIVFNNAAQTIVATGSPRVWQGDNVVHGSKITVYIKEERTVVEGDPTSRATATINPDSSKKKP
jgi:lipopolysaccharide export system protein LptA